MKKRAFQFAMVFVVAALALAPIVSGHGNKAGTSTTEIGGGEVTVKFTGPSANGRDVMSLIQPGSYWRMGADSATTLTTDVDLKFGDMVVPKGTYKLVAQFDENKEWSLIVAEDLGGGFAPTKVVGKTPGAVAKQDKVVENMTIELKASGSKGTLVLNWGTARLTAEFSAA